MMIFTRLSSLVARNSQVILLLALSSFAWLPLVTPGYFMQAHDAPHSLFFLQAFDEVMRGGSWWPRWGPNFAFGYGYPLWIFYAPLTYFIGEAFHSFGASITTAMKLVDIAATIGATLAMYVWARHHFQKPAAAFAAIVYTYTPYHLLDLYVRSAVAEYFTFVWFPLVLWRWELLLETPSRRNAIAAALVTAALVLTHQGAAFIFALLLAAYLLFVFARSLTEDRMRKTSGNLRRLTFAVMAAALTLGLSAIFWLPMLLEQKYIVVEQWTSVAYNYQKHFVFLNQFFSPFWGYGYSDEWLNDDMGFQLGMMPIVAAVVALVILKPLQSARTNRLSTTIFFFLASVIVVALMSPLSAPFWNTVSIAALVQFPWRLLALSTITLAWLAGAAVEAVSSEKPAVSREHHTVHGSAFTVHHFLLMLVVVVASYNYALPQYTARSVAGESARAAVDFELVSYKDRTGYMTWASAQPSSSPLVAEYEANAPLTKAVVLHGDASIEALHHGGESERMRVRASAPTTIQFRTYYFPGWRARVDDQPAALYPSGAYALIAVDVPAGEHDVSLQFEDTTVHWLAKWISALSVIGVIAWSLLRLKEGR